MLPSFFEVTRTCGGGVYLGVGGGLQARLDHQNAMFIPMSTLRGFWTEPGAMKNGDVITPLKPVRFA